MFSAPTSKDLPLVIVAVLAGAVLIVAAIVQLQRDRAMRSSEELRNRRRNYFPLALVLGIALLTNLAGIVIEHAEIDDVGGDILTSSLMAIGIAAQLYRLRTSTAR
ncbi:MAG: hypothetical protein ABI334_05875 [Candidatus Dormiibacterota bacterium]